MDDFLWMGVSAAVTLLVFFGGIALLVLISSRSEAKERELAHTERMRALELGQPLPDAEVARARSDASRAWARGLSAAAASLGMAGAAIAATALVLPHAEPRSQVPLLCVIWGVCGLVALTAVSVGLASSRRRERPSKPEAAPLTSPHKEQPEVNAAIREEVPPRSPSV